MLGGVESGDGRAKGWMAHVWLHWISPSWVKLLGMKVQQKGRQLPWSAQPCCIHPCRDLCDRKHGICRG